MLTPITPRTVAPAGLMVRTLAQLASAPGTASAPDADAGGDDSGQDATPTASAHAASPPTPPILNWDQLASMRAAAPGYGDASGGTRGSSRSSLIDDSDIEVVGAGEPGRHAQATNAVDAAGVSGAGMDTIEFGMIADEHDGAAGAQVNKAYGASDDADGTGTADVGRAGKDVVEFGMIVDEHGEPPERQVNDEGSSSGDGVGDSASADSDGHARADDNDGPGGATRGDEHDEHMGVDEDEDEDLSVDISMEDEAHHAAPRGAGAGVGAGAGAEGHGGRLPGWVPRKRGRGPRQKSRTRKRTKRIASRDGSDAVANGGGE